MGLLLLLLVVGCWLLFVGCWLLFVVDVVLLDDDDDDVVVVVVVVGGGGGGGASNFSLPKTVTCPISAKIHSFSDALVDLGCHPHVGDAARENENQSIFLESLHINHPKTTFIFKARAAIPSSFLKLKVLYMKIHCCSSYNISFFKCRTHRCQYDLKEKLVVFTELWSCQDGQSSSQELIRKSHLNSSSKLLLWPSVVLPPCKELSYRSASLANSTNHIEQSSCVRLDTLECFRTL